MRYRESKIFKDENGTQYLNRVQYPVIPVADSDVIITGVKGVRMDNLAFKYYGNQELWWIIARANNQNNGSMYLQVGRKYRIPQNTGKIIRLFQKLND